MMVFKKPTKYDVMSFLDKTERISHNESKVELLRVNFGFSWPLCHAYVDVWQEENNKRELDCEK